MAAFKKIAKVADDRHEQIHMVLIAFKASIRPDINQLKDVLQAFEAISGLNADNLCVMFTHCE